MSARNRRLWCRGEDCSALLRDLESEQSYEARIKAIRFSSTRGCPLRDIENLKDLVI